jgi:hypothetical protein
MCYSHKLHPSRNNHLPFPKRFNISLSIPSVPPNDWLSVELGIENVEKPGFNIGDAPLPEFDKFSM